MSLLSLVAALLVEQWRPLADRRYLYALLARYATFSRGYSMPAKLGKVP